MSPFSMPDGYKRSRYQQFVVQDETLRLLREYCGTCSRRAGPITKRCHVGSELEVAINENCSYWHSNFMALEPKKDSKGLERKVVCTVM